MKKTKSDLIPHVKRMAKLNGFQPTGKQGRYKRFGVLYEVQDHNKLKTVRRVEPLTDCIKYHGEQYVNTYAASKMLGYEYRHATREIKRYPVRTLDVDLSHSTYWKKSDIEAIKDGTLKKIDELEFLNRCEGLKFRIRKIDDGYYYIANQGNLQISLKCKLPEEDIKRFKKNERFKLYPREKTDDLYYLISNYGNIINLSYNRILKQDSNDRFYTNVIINGESNGAHIFVGRLWIPVGNPERIILHHINKRKGNNSIRNLVRCTPTEHKYLHELYDKIAESDTKEAKAAAKKAYRDYIHWLRNDDKTYIAKSAC